MSNQEFGKTSFQDFRPSFGKSKKIIQTFFQNIPKNHPTKNSEKRPSQLLDHLLYFYVDLQNHTIMVTMQIARRTASKA
jgi:hypothetical protein